MEKLFKVAYMISAYTEPVSLQKMINALDNSEVCFFIHIDKKVDIRPFCENLDNRENVFFLPEKKRVKVFWGGYSQVRMQYNLITEVMDSKYQFIKVVNLTGTDYPIWSNTDLLNKFCSENEYIYGYRIADDDTKNNSEKLTYYHYMDGAKIIHYLVELMHVNRKKSVRNMQYEFYFGSEYWALSYEILQVLIQKWDRDIKLQKFLKWAFAPSEIWIHTLFFNSKYRDKGTEFTGEYKGIFELSPLSFFKYNKKIEVLTEKDYSDILLSKKCFARKIIVGKSDSLINLIEKGR